MIKSNRKYRVASTIKKELSIFFARQDISLTIVDVTINDSLTTAKVFLDLNSYPQKSFLLLLLQKKVVFFRKILSDKISSRSMPDILFKNSF